MTSELRSCNWCGMSEQTCGDEACPQKHDTRNRTTSILEAVAEHPADPLAGLARWKHCEYPNQHKMMEHKDGDYVLHSEAAKIIYNLKSQLENERDQQVHEENNALKYELSQIKALLKDPDTVHIALLRGDIAKPTAAQINHVYVASVSDSLNAKIEKMQEALVFYSDVRKYPAPLTGGMGELWEDCGQKARAALNVEESNDKG